MSEPSNAFELWISCTRLCPVSDFIHSCGVSYTLFCSVFCYYNKIPKSGCFIKKKVYYAHSSADSEASCQYLPGSGEPLTTHNMADGIMVGEVTWQEGFGFSLFKATHS
jgi:hypothetical protein